MTGHRSEHLIWAPNPQDDLPFTLYALDSEHKSVYTKAAMYVAENRPFDTVDELQFAVECAIPEASHWLNHKDYCKLFIDDDF